MDNDFLKNQIELGEQANAYANLHYSNDQKRRAEDRLREAENNLAHAQMKKEAEAHEAEDKKFTELVEVRNQADQLISAVEKTIKENEDKLQGTEKEDMEKAIEELKSVKDSDNVDEIRAKIDGLSKAAEGFSTRIYQEAQANAAQNGEAQGGNDSDGSDDVQDAEVVED